MKRKKRIIILALCIIFALFCLYRIYGMDKVKVLRSDSSFDDFYVEEDKVYIKCHIAIQNSNDVDEYISLAANMEEDAANGLLKSSTIFGYDKAEKRGFMIPANSIKEYECVFIGDFAGTAQKHDRNLPEIDVMQIESDVDAYAEYENVIYYTPHSGSALYKYTPEDDRKECLLKEGVDWFTIYEGNILTVWMDNIMTYDLQTGTIQTLVEPLNLGWPFCAERNVVPGYRAI